MRLSNPIAVAKYFYMGRGGGALYQSIANFQKSFLWGHAPVEDLTSILRA